MPQPNPGNLARSPYEAELRNGSPRLRFPPALEAEFSRVHLFHTRTLIRVVCLLGALLAAARGLEHAFVEAPDTLQLTGLTAAFVLSSVLAGLAWSTAFERLYLPCAQILVPLRNVIATVLISHAAAEGRVEEFMVLPLMIIGPFFFLGFRFRAALATSVLGLAAFIVSGPYFDLPLPMLLRALSLLVVTGAACAVAALSLERRMRASFLESRLVTEQAERDGLTGLSNRRVFDDFLARLWQQAVADRRTLVLMLIDVDHFKSYNDRYGHQAGDQTLRQVAHAIQRFTRRPLDVLARYGGEEFAAILFDVDSHQARNVAERMRAAVEELAIEHRASRTAAVVTISIGIAVVQPNADRKPLGALQLADEALYEAKAQGRNRVEVKGDVEYSGLVTGVFSRLSL